MQPCHTDPSNTVAMAPYRGVAGLQGCRAAKASKACVAPAAGPDAPRLFFHAQMSRV
jgi:hypothetical protein